MYCGPTSSLPVEKLLTLDCRWAFQPKIDGVYCTVTTDANGRIANMLYRSGERVTTHDSDGLIGQYIGLPDSVVHGELEAQTEASLRARATRRFACVHLFDASRIASSNVTTSPFYERYGWLQRWRAYVDCYEREACTPVVTRRDENRFVRDVLGRFVRPAKGAVVRFPIVPNVFGRGAVRGLWASFVETGGEGVVAIRLDAPFGARGAKKKCRATTTFDCVVTAVSPRVAQLVYRGYSFVVSAAGKAAIGIRPGDLVEVAANGWYEGSIKPKHARIVRVRRDIMSVRGSQTAIHS